MATQHTRAYVYKQGRWVLIGSSGSTFAAIVAQPEPPNPGIIGSLWINPAEMPIDMTVVDVLEAIRGQVIAPKAIDLDGPNTLYITVDADGAVKLGLRADSAKAGKLDSLFATEQWVLDNAGGVHVGPDAPSNTGILWLNPQGTGGSTADPPFVVSETTPLTVNSLWLNPQG